MSHRLTAYLDGPNSPIFAAAEGPKVFPERNRNQRTFYPGEHLSIIPTSRSITVSSCSNSASPPPFPSILAHACVFTRGFMLGWSDLRLCNPAKSLQSCVRVP